ncbi:MAG: hypothetical protein K8S87_08580 [Planctomycetes bacterium]|nr:hypothetical protein [Planctomycetota bacterium]
MISLIIKAPAVDYISGAVLNATFEGDSICISNQQLEHEDCDILFREDFGIKARIGWNESGHFFLSEVDFNNKFIEVVTTEIQLCIDLVKDSSKEFSNIKDEIVMLNFNDEIEFFISVSKKLPENEPISPLGREVVTLTEKARNKIVDITTHRDSDKKTAKKNTKHVEEPDDATLEFEEFDIEKEDYRTKSDVKTYPAPKKDETAMTYGDVAWWASQTDDGLNEEFVPNGDTKINELDIDEDIDEIEETYQKDGDYFRKFDDEMHEGDSDSEDSLAANYSFEFPKYLFFLKTSTIKLDIDIHENEGQRIKAIPRFPGCNVQPDKFIFDNEAIADDADSDDETAESFFVTPFKLGKCENCYFEFWSNGTILWRKYLAVKSVRLPIFFKLVMGLLLILFAGLTAFILHLENLITIYTFNVSVAALIILVLVYVLTGNKSCRFSEDTHMHLDSSDDEDSE